MNRRNIHIVNGIIISFLVLLVLGCKDRSDNKTTANGGQQNANVESKDSSDGAVQDNDGMLEIVDIAGRTVTVPTGNVKVILDSSMMIYGIAPLFGKNGNPFTSIVGWDRPLDRDPDIYEILVEKFPEISAISVVGRLYRGNFGIEKVVSLNADIVFLRLGSFVRAQEIGLIEKLEKVGIKTVFIDWGKNLKQNTIPSMLLLGQIFEKTDEASKFVNFYFAQMQKVHSIVDTIQEDKKPLVFMEAGFGKVGEYRVYGQNVWGLLVEFAGGRNYGTEVFGSKMGTISAEQLFVIDPDVIIGTGGNWSKTQLASKAVLLGYKATREDAQERLKNITFRTGWKTLKAVQNKRVHSILHRFKDSPYHFIAIQQMAKWIYPDKFANIDPEKTFIEFHDTFLPISYSGLFWVSLE